MICQLCKGSDLKKFSKIDSKSGEALRLQFCNFCGLFQQSDIPSEKDLIEYYARAYRQDYKNTPEPKRKHIWRAGLSAISRLELLRSVLPTSPAGNKLLDVGAGGGEFVYFANIIGFEAEGLEPNVGYSDFARNHYDVRISQGDIQSLGPESVDIVTLFHVLEHLPDPVRAVEKIYAALRQNGTLFIEVPNILQKDASPSNIFFKAHLFYFSASSLRLLLDPYFDLIILNEDGNLKAIFRKRDAVDTKKNFFNLQANSDYQLFLKKGWLQYLFAGGGMYKPLTKLMNFFDELSLREFTPKEILNILYRIKKGEQDDYTAAFRRRTAIYKFALFCLIGTFALYTFGGI